MIIIRIAAIAIGICICIMEFAGICDSYAESDVASQIVEKFSTDAMRFDEQLIELARANKVPINLELKYEPNEKAMPKLTREKITIGEIITDIVKERVGYSWQSGKKWINVYYSPLSQDAKNFLNIKVPHFSITNGDILWISKMLQVELMSEANRERGKNGIAGSISSPWPVPPKWDQLLTIESNNQSVREILNSLVGENGNAFWTALIDTENLMDNQKYYAQRSIYEKERVPKIFHWSIMPIER